METNDKKTVSATGSTGSSQIAVSAEMKTEPTNKKKKKGSTKATRRAADVEKKVNKALRRFARAGESMSDTYTKRRDKSDTKRKDGALIDMPENVMRAVAKSASKAAPAVGDMMKAISNKKTRKSARRSFRSMPAIPFM